MKKVLIIIEVIGLVIAIAGALMHNSIIITVGFLLTLVWCVWVLTHVEQNNKHETTLAVIILIVAIVTLLLEFLEKFS